MDERTRRWPVIGGQSHRAAPVRRPANRRWRGAGGRPSDWVVTPVGGSYADDEAYFLHFIVHTLESALRTRPELEGRALARWVERRHRQIERGELTYIAHQLDVFGSVRGRALGTPPASHHTPPVDTVTGLRPCTVIAPPRPREASRTTRSRSLRLRPCDGASNTAPRSGCVWQGAG